MSGDHRLNREQKPARSKTSLIIILLVLFAAAGIAITLMFSRFDASMPAQLMAP
jgi:flagellar basal body-associated protein FliL